MSEFHARDSDDIPVFLGQHTILGDLSDESLQLANAHVVGDGNRAIAILDRPMHEFQG
ncbi:hypothetical protein M1N13_03635 [Dehalococcoidia bacterium]|nr:hypothetical protein [Dehalococcoidia bacterium]